MGLNSFTFNYASMRYYLDMGKPVGHKGKLHKLADTKKIKRSVMFAKDGVYFYNRGILYKHKLQLDERTPKDSNYIGNHTLYQTDTRVRQDKAVYRLPIEHIIGVETTVSYKLAATSPVTFVVEEINGKITDYYFESRARPREIRAEISSFLSALK